MLKKARAPPRADRKMLGCRLVRGQDVLLFPKKEIAGAILQRFHVCPPYHQYGGIFTTICRKIAQPHLGGKFNSCLPGFLPVSPRNSRGGIGDGGDGLTFLLLVLYAFSGIGNMQFARQGRLRPGLPPRGILGRPSSKRREENGKMKIKTTSSGHGTSISPKASRKLKNLGFLCSLLVVAYHVEWPKDVPFSFGWFIYQGIADGVARMAVPFFFVVSGFFLARHFGEKGWWLRETRKRARSLLLPFFLWSLLALLVSILSPVIDGMLSKHLAETSFHFPRPVDWPRIFGLDFSRYPLNYPLWYLRGLFVLVLLSPALGYLVATVRLPCLATAFCLLLFCWRLPVGHWHVFLFHAATGLFYFSVGIALDKVRPAISFRTASFAAVAGLALLAAKMVSASVKWHFQYELAALSLPCFLVAAWTFGPESEWPAFLTTCAFPIFLMHIPVIWIVNALLRHAALGTLATAFAQLAVGIICPCAFSCLLHRHVPKVASVLFGGR